MPQRIGDTREIERQDGAPPLAVEILIVLGLFALGMLTHIIERCAA